MAPAGAAGADKENAAPSASAAATAAVPRRHGYAYYAVKSCGVRKRASSRPRRPGRVPLRDITNLVAAASVPVPEDAAAVAPVPGEEGAAKPEPVLPAAAMSTVAVQGGVAGGAPAKAAVARYSLRKHFR